MADATRRTVTLAEWKAEGEQLFGPDMLDWRFVCPSCGHVQSPRDFDLYWQQGATPEDARFNCIGRFDGHMDVEICSGSSPCNYTGGGLFRLCPVTVVDEGNGNKYACFEFDRSGDEAATEEVSGD